MAWQDAIETTPEGVRLLLEVSAGARQAAFPAGYNKWRGRIGIRVRAPAQGGKANQEVCALVADVLGVPAAAVRLTAGASDTRKTIAVTGVARDDVVARLEVA